MIPSKLLVATVVVAMVVVATAEVAMAVAATEEEATAVVAKAAGAVVRVAKEAGVDAVAAAAEVAEVDAEEEDGEVKLDFFFAVSYSRCDYRLIHVH